MDTLSKDFVSLPIIITDWDALVETKNHIQVPTAEIQRSQTVSKMAPANPADGKPTYTESVEEIWSRISDKTKEKIREAAIEVLRRTDASSSSLEKMSFHYDDDARFLD